MLIKHLLVEEIVYKKAKQDCFAHAVLYTFSEEIWVSAHSDRHLERIGPMTLLTGEDSEAKVTNLKDFGKRRLAVEKGKENPVISYRDQWTIPANSIYCFVMPRFYVADEFVFESNLHEPQPVLGLTPKKQLFYHKLFPHLSNKKDTCYFRLSARLNYSPKRLLQQANAVDVVEGTGAFERFAQGTMANISKPETWFSLLEITKKLLD